MTVENWRRGHLKGLLLQLKMTSILRLNAAGADREAPLPAPLSSLRTEEGRRVEETEINPLSSRQSL